MTKSTKKGGFVNIKKTMGPRGSLHKALGMDPKKKIGPAKLAQIAKGTGPNAKKAKLALTLHHEWPKSKKKP